MPRKKRTLSGSPKPQPRGLFKPLAAAHFGTRSRIRRWKCAPGPVNCPKNEADDADGEEFEQVAYLTASIRRNLEAEVKEQEEE